MNSKGKRIVLAVTGSIAAYKAAELLRLLAAAGHDVRVLQTPASRKFVGELTFQALSGYPVACEQFSRSPKSVFSHIELAASDLLLVAPATAGTIGKMSAGIADNLLLTTYLATEAPTMICPAMNHRMWNHPAVRENIETLRRRGVIIAGPDTGELACGEDGAGRMVDPGEIMRQVDKLFCDGGETIGEDSGRESGQAITAGRPKAVKESKVSAGRSDTGQAHGEDLKGVNILVTAGGTREPIDFVRYITNRSSGRMGYALSEAARDRGASVTVIAANCALKRNPGIRYIDVVTASELQTAVESEFESCDVLLMAAAVSDYKVSDGWTKGKIDRKEKNDLQLVPTSDIVSSLKANGNGRLKVGFSAEYGEENRERARRKLNEKGLGMIVFNDISRADIGFESMHNEITIMMPGREDIFIGKTSKRNCAERILDQVAELLD